MTIRRLLRIVLKIITCAVGGLLAGMVIVFTIEFVLDGNLHGDADLVIGWSFVIGLFFGISWAIEHKKARKAFIAAPLTAAVLGGICAAIVGNVHVITVAVLVGFFIGTVSALAAAGAYRSK